MTYFDPPGPACIDVAPVLLRDSAAGQRGQLARQQVALCPAPRIVRGGRPSAPTITVAASQPSPQQDNDGGPASAHSGESAQGSALEHDVSAIIDALAYIETDVEHFVPLAALDIRRASDQLRQLICRTTCTAPRCPIAAANGGKGNAYESAVPGMTCPFDGTGT